MTEQRSFLAAAALVCGLAAGLFVIWTPVAFAHKDGPPSTSPGDGAIDKSAVDNDHGDHDHGDPIPPYAGPGHSGFSMGPDQNGYVYDMAASGVSLLSWIPIGDFPYDSSAANDIWGYVSPSGREYALIGLYEGTGFVDVTDPVNPVIVGFIRSYSSTWRDIKTYGHYAYTVNETAGGIEVIDLDQIDSGVVSLVGYVRDITWANHNIALNPDSGYIYLAGSSAGTLPVYDLTDPAAPALAGLWNTGNYIHDVLIVSYDEGPYAGREIAFAAASGAGLLIIDVTDKSNIFLVSQSLYPNRAFCHYVALSDDRRYVFVNDEGDEGRTVSTTTTYVFDVRDLEGPTYLGSFTNGLAAIDHNPMFRDNYVFEANYRSGLRIWDVYDQNNYTEVGYFDTYPANNNRGFDGAWGVYAGLPSGIVIVSDIQRGLFVLDVSAATYRDCNSNGQDDAQEVRDGLSPDCDGNGMPDSCDLASGYLLDEDNDQVPDICAGAPCPYDLNGDGIINISDFVLFAAAYGSASGDPNYDAAADFNGDGVINIQDFTAFAIFYGTSC